MPRRAVARVDLGAIQRNCEVLRARLGPGPALCAVVKADGYGHGAVPVARAALAGGASWLAVATAAEASALRSGGLAGPVLVMGALSPQEAEEAVAARADVVAWREGFLQRLTELVPEGATVGVHVKLDTGMGRLGTRDEAEARGVAALAAAAPRLRLAGAMTHFAVADEDPAFTAEQLRRFGPFAQACRALAPELLAHAANSAATLREPASHLDLVRCGVAVYGLDPMQRDPAEHGLEPALALESYVAEVKRCEPGQSAGYGRRFVADRPCWLATIPIGYGDGLRRGLGGRARVLVRGRSFPLVGTISMDNVTALLSTAGEPGVARGDRAVLIGADGSERIAAEELARELGTINYEVTCAISARVPRVHERDGAPA